MITIGLLASCSRTSQPASDTRGAGSPAATWALSLQPLELPASGHTAEPQLTAAGDAVVLSWLEHGPNTVTLKFAERAARGWSPARTIATGNDWFVSWADVPSVLRMSDGTLVASWYPATDSAADAYDLRLAYSRDNGATWSRPIAPHHDGTKTQHGFASLFELPGRRLGLVWLDGRDQELNSVSPDGGAMALYFASFTPQWAQEAETRVDARVCECCAVSTAVTSDGVVAAFRDRSPREIRDISISRLDNGAWTDARPLHVDGWEINACPVNGPMVSARGRQVAAAWFTGKDDSGRAYVAFSSDAGRSWGDPIRLDDDTALGHVDIELLEDGSAAATWVELAGGRARLRVRRVEPSGARSASVEVAGAAGGRVVGHPRVGRAGDELIFVWTESGETPGEPERIRGAVARVPGLL
jgi:hypothetical protein